LAMRKKQTTEARNSEEKTLFFSKHKRKERE
jgi:hypothetical protein